MKKDDNILEVLWKFRVTRNSVLPSAKRSAFWVKIISENFNNFVLTIGCTAVAIYCKGNVGLKMFDSQARDIYDRRHSQGTCVLLGVSSLNSLVYYIIFRASITTMIYLSWIGEINKVQNSTLFQSHACKTRKFNVSCAVAIYSLCYSVMKSCRCWNSNTTNVIPEWQKIIWKSIIFKQVFTIWWFVKNCWCLWNSSKFRSEKWLQWRNIVWFSWHQIISWKSGKK